MGKISNKPSETKHILALKVVFMLHTERFKCV